jgi:hypothetical protein
MQIQKNKTLPNSILERVLIFSTPYEHRCNINNSS